MSWTCVQLDPDENIFEQWRCDSCGRFMKYENWVRNKPDGWYKPVYCDKCKYRKNK